MFTDRNEAGKRLAQKLGNYRGADAIVLALPRGGVVLGFEVSRALALPLDIIAVRKIGHPTDPEYAVGAVDEHGAVLVNEREAATLSQPQLQKVITKETKEARRRAAAYRNGLPPQALAGKVVIIVDDGIATGFTARLAVRSVRAMHPKLIIVAVPVAPLDAINSLKKEGADKVVTLEPPEEFAGSVGAHYLYFEQVSDEEVIKLLHPAHA